MCLESYLSNVRFALAIFLVTLSPRPHLSRIDITNAPLGYEVLSVKSCVPLLKSQSRISESLVSAIRPNLGEGGSYRTEFAAPGSACLCNALADLIITLLNNIADQKLFGEFKPDLATADETTLSSETTSLLAFSKMPLIQDGILPATAWLNLGDPKQSNNVVVSITSNNHFNAQQQVPMITRLVAANYPYFEFNNVFRSCSGYMDWINSKYYGGRLT